MPRRRDAMKHSMLAQRRSSDIYGNPGPGHGPAWAWDAAMRTGDFQAAWSVSDAVLAARDPAYRPACRDDPRRPYHERWVWDGRPFDGRRVLVRCYHGLGDTLQFCRFLPALRARAAHVVLEVQPELLALLRALPGVDRLHPFDPAHPLPPDECDIEVMELCHALRLVPETRAYLHADRMPGVPGGTGLCWAAGGWDPARGLDPALLRPVAGPRPISLQRGPASRDAGVLAATDPLDGSMDILATAGLLMALDDVVTVDTMAAHLAGALGRPTTVLLKHTPDWRWGKQGLWYASVRTVRQPAPGDWPGAIAELARTQAGTLPGPKGL